MTSGWDNFWKGQKDSFGEIMRINTDFFGQQLARRLSLRPGDQILDYGCGPGYLADYFAGRNISIVGADINEFFIAQCRSNHPDTLFIPITTDPARNQAILKTQLADRKFDYIVLLSIAQYFKDLDTLDRVVHLLTPFVAEGGRIIIADVIDEQTSAVRDVLSLFIHCLRKGRLVRFTRFILYLLFSDYRTISRNTELLKIPESFIAQTAIACGLYHEKVSGLTIHPTRTTYVLTRV